MPVNTSFKLLVHCQFLDENYLSNPTSPSYGIPVWVFFHFGIFANPIFCSNFLLWAYSLDKLLECPSAFLKMLYPLSSGIKKDLFFIAHSNVIVFWNNKRK